MSYLWTQSLLCDQPTNLVGYLTGYKEPSHFTELDFAGPKRALIGQYIGLNRLRACLSVVYRSSFRNYDQHTINMTSEGTAAVTTGQERVLTRPYFTIFRHYFTT